MTPSDEFFWERLLDMPDVEAVQELSSRRTKLLERMTEINAYWAGRYVTKSAEDVEQISHINNLITKINEEIKMRSRRMDNANWRKAVRAIYGEEGYNLCREWIVMNERMAK